MSTNARQEHKDDIEEQKDDMKEQKQPSRSKIQQIDEGLRAYYKTLEEKNYCEDGAERGKFSIWCEDNGYDSELLEEEINGKPEEAMCVDFDDIKNFPLNHEVTNDKERTEKIFKILKNLYEDRAELDLSDFELNVAEDLMLDAKMIYEKHIQTVKTDDGYNFLSDFNILYWLTVSCIHSNQNLLLNLIDACKRDIIAKQVKHKLLHDTEDTEDADVIEYPNGNAENARIEKWISDHSFLKKLDAQLKTRTFNRFKLETPNYYRIENRHELELKANKLNNPIKLELKAILTAYPKRIGERLTTVGNRLIDGDLKVISKYILASFKFLTQLINKETYQIGGPPFLFDFIFLLKPSKSADIFNPIDHGNGDNSDDEDAEPNPADESGKIVYDKDIIGDVLSDLRQNNCIHHSYNIEDEDTDEKLFEIKARNAMKDAFTKLRELLSIEPKGTYPQNCRFNMIVDRRKKRSEGKENPLIVFEPPNGCNKVEKANLPECYFDLSRQCIIPRPGFKPFDKRTADEKIEHGKADKKHIEKLTTQTIDATTPVQGQIMTFSYHVWAADEIKCYLLWNGRCHRFYPQDIIELLPHIFVKSKENKEFVKSTEVKRLVMEMEITDSKFEKFYRGLNRLHDFQFPKQYNVTKGFPEYSQPQ